MVNVELQLSLHHSDCSGLFHLFIRGYLLQLGMQTSVVTV